MYDIVVITDSLHPSYELLVKKYPFIKKAKNFNEARSIAMTKMFWVVWDYIFLDENFNFDFEPPDYDKKYVHIFSVENSDLPGVCLFPKDLHVSTKELEYKFFANSKKIDIISAIMKPSSDIIVITGACHPSYELLVKKYPFIKKAKNFNEAQSIATTDMFWVIWDYILVNGNFDFLFEPLDYDKKYVHIFSVENSDLPGVCLVPKDLHVSTKELEYKFFANSKKIDIISSVKRLYDVFYPKSYEDYLKIFDTASTEMYWVVHPSLEVMTDFKFDFVIDQNNEYEKNITHVFLNKDIDVDTFNGILLCSKNIRLHQDEFELRILDHKKEHPVLASFNKPYDIFFISYNDVLADSKFETLQKKFPRVKHIKDINGIFNAHKKAAELSTTPMFWVIDSDARLVEDFKFDLLVPKYNHSSVFVWHSKNPVNDLEYGYGAVKLLPKISTMKVENNLDMTMSISKNFYVIEEVSNYTDFNTDPFNSWKSAFRECVKLTLKSDNDPEAAQRLEVWCTVGKDKRYGNYVIDGANQGKLYAKNNADNQSALLKINDFNWLEDQFEIRSEINGNTFEITSAQALATS
jgi:hypothetical protein